MPKLEDLTGQRFGRWTVLHRAPNDGKRVMWFCRCDCGTERTVNAHILKTKSKSCGCWASEVIANRHNAGCKKHPLYGLYNGIKVRCYTVTDMHYPDYGARGIRMADEWKDDFWAFAKYLESLPHYGESGYSIDRIDVNGDYAPGNLRWATAKEQANNKRNNKCVTAFGKTKTVSEWADEFGMNYYTLWSRINERGMRPELAMTTPTHRQKEVTNNA